MNIKYFKVMRGFNQDDYIPITESELKKAIYAHITGTNVAFEMGSITGPHISAVVPDFHRTLGWNDIRGRGLENTMRNLIAEAKQTVQDVIASGDKRLLSDEQRKLN
jgi:hypothetical protein